MGLKFNPPPGWPLPWDFEPPPGWEPDPGWPEPPQGWPLWIGSEAPRVIYQVPSGQGYVPGYIRDTLVSEPPATRRRRRWRWSAAKRTRRAREHRGRTRGGHHRRSRKPSAGGQAVLGVVGLAAVGFIVFELLGAGVGDPSGASTTSGGRHGTPVSLLSLRTGACFKDLAQAADRVAADVTPVSCALAHNAQVYARFRASGGLAYPGRTALLMQGRRDCRSILAVKLDRSKLTSRISFVNIVPSRQRWAAGQRMISCVAVDPASQLTTSLLKTHRSAGQSRSQPRRALGGGERKRPNRAGARHPQGRADGQARATGW